MSAVLPQAAYIQSYLAALRVWREPLAEGRVLEDFGKALDVLMQAHGMDDVLLGQAVCMDFDFESTLAINVIGQSNTYPPPVRHAMLQSLLDRGCDPNHRVGLGKASAFEFLVMSMHAHDELREDVALMEMFLRANGDYADKADERLSPQDYIEQSHLKADFAHSPAIACLRAVIRASKLRATWPQVGGPDAETPRL